METLISSRCRRSMSCLLPVTHPLKWLASQQNHNFLTSWKRQKCAGLRRAWRPGALWCWQCFSRKCLPSLIGTSCTPWILMDFECLRNSSGHSWFQGILSMKADKQIPEISLLWFNSTAWSVVHQRSRRNMLCSSCVNKQTTKKERHQRWSEALGFCVPKIREDLCINPSFLREAPPGLPGRVTLGLHKEGVLGAKMIASNVFVEDHNKLNLNLEVAFNLLSLQMYILNNKNTTLWSSNSSRWWELSRSFHRCGSSKKTSICSQRRDLDNLKARKQCNWEIKNPPEKSGTHGDFYRIDWCMLVSTEPESHDFFSVSWTKATSGWPHRQSSVNREPE